MSKERKKELSLESNLQDASDFVTEEASHIWQDLAHKLGSKHNKIEVIKKDHPNDTKEQCHYYLQSWREEEGDGATVNALCTALSKCGQQKTRQNMEKKLGIYSQILGTIRKRTASKEEVNDDLKVKNYFYQLVEPNMDTFSKYLANVASEASFKWDAISRFGGIVRDVKPGCVETAVQFQEVNELREFHDTMTAARRYGKRFITKTMKIAAGLDPEGDYIALPCINERQYQDILQNLKDVEKGYHSDSDLHFSSKRAKLSQQYTKSQQALSAERRKVSKLKVVLKINENKLKDCEQSLADTKKKLEETASYALPKMSAVLDIHEELKALTDKAEATKIKLQDKIYILTAKLSEAEQDLAGYKTLTIPGGKTDVDNASNRSLGRVGMAHGTAVLSSGSSGGSSGASYSDYYTDSSSNRCDTSDTLTKVVYVDNYINRHLGRVGMEKDSMVVSEGSATTSTELQTDKPCLYVDNAYTRSLGRVGLPQLRRVGLLHGSRPVSMSRRSTEKKYVSKQTEATLKAFDGLTLDEDVDVSRNVGEKGLTPQLPGDIAINPEVSLFF